VSELQVHSGIGWLAAWYFLSMFSVEGMTEAVLESLAGRPVKRLIARASAELSDCGFCLSFWMALGATVLGVVAGCVPLLLSPVAWFGVWRGSHAWHGFVRRLADPRVYKPLEVLVRAQACALTDGGEGAEEAEQVPDDGGGAAASGPEGGEGQGEVLGGEGGQREGAEARQESVSEEDQEAGAVPASHGGADGSACSPGAKGHSGVPGGGPTGESGGVFQHPGTLDLPGGAT